MDPLTLMSALFGGGTALAGLLGGGGQDQFDQLLKRLMALTSPQAIGKDARGFEAQILNSPGFAQAMRGAHTGANRLSQNINQSLAQRGLTTSGVGAVASPLARSAGSFQLGNLRAGASTQAFDMARAMAMARLQGIQGQMPGQQGRELLGTGVQSIFDLLKLLQGQAGQRNQLFNVGNQIGFGVG